MDNELKILRVCLSRDLPILEERLSNYIYFAYDKLILYAGDKMINENFAIVDEMPSEPVYGMLYILRSDGSVHRYIDYSDQKIARIERNNQIEILKKAGTAYYIDNDHRYIDTQTRTLTLPFNDGQYELNVSMRKEQKFDRNTIIRYDEKTNRFKLFGEISDDFIDYSKDFRGAETGSLRIDVNGPRISGEVRLSSAIDNIIQLASDGLYANVGDKVDSAVYNAWKNKIENFKVHAQNALEQIEDQIAQVESLITKEQIRLDIMSVLQSRFDNIQKAIDDYDEILRQLEGLETDLILYTNQYISNTRNDILNAIEENSNWFDYDNAHSEYYEDIDYYEIAKEYYTWGPEHPTDLEYDLMASAISYLAINNIIDENIKIFIINIEGLEYEVSAYIDGGVVNYGFVN